MHRTEMLLTMSSPEARAELADGYAMHARVMSGFPEVDDDDSARQAHGVLYHLGRVDGGRARLTVQSLCEPAGWALPAGYLDPSAPRPATRSVGDEIASIVRLERVLRFSLTTHPVRRPPTRPLTAKRAGRSVFVEGSEARAVWLLRRGAEVGFEPALETLRCVDEPLLHGQRPLDPAAPPITIRPVTFEGLLRVKEPERLLKAIARGIGPAKAYGCGLLFVSAPPAG